jgi:hypothetical protein
VNTCFFLLSAVTTNASQPLRVYSLKVFSAEAISAEFSLFQESVISPDFSSLAAISGIAFFLQSEVLCSDSHNS